MYTFPLQDHAALWMEAHFLEICSPGCRSGGCSLLWPRWRKHSGEKSYSITSARNPTAQTVQIPRAGLVLDASRNFYGTTPYGDASSSCCGTVFKLTPVWRFLRAAKHGGHGV